MKTINIADGSIGKVLFLKKFIEKCIKNLDVSGLFFYQDTQGDEKLRKAIIKKWKLKVNPENLLITSSSQQALHIIFEYLYKDKNIALIQSPAYFGVWRLLKKNALTFESIKDVKNYKNIPKNSFAYLSSNFHNPTGLSLSSNEKTAWLKLANKNNIMIVEDNPYDLLFLEGKMPSRIFDLNQKNVIFISGFSKILAPGFRLGFIAGNLDTIKALKSIKISNDIFSSSLAQEIAYEYLRNNELLAQTRDYFRKKRNFMLKLLDKYFKNDPKIKWNKPKGSIFIRLEFEGKLVIQELAKKLQEQHKVIIDKDCFSYKDRKSRNTTRINFVGNSNKDMERAILALRDSWHGKK